MKSRNRKAVSYRLRPKIKYLFIACTTIILGLDLASAQSFTATLGSFDNATKAYALNYAPSAPSFASSPTTFVNSGLTSDVTASTAYVNYSGWDNQSNFYYYSITAASGYNLTITGINSNIRSSNTGPKTVAVETATSLGGPWTQQALSSLSGTTAADVNSPALSIALTSGQTLYIRYRNTSITSANNGTVASGGTNRLNSGSISGTYSPSCTSQTISPITSTLTKTYGDAAYSVATTASSGLTVAYTSSNTAVATVNASGTVTIVGVGTATITAAQAGNGTYCAATSVTQALTVNKKNITVTGITANDKVFDGTIAATLSGTATLSGLVAADAGNVTLGGTGSATFADAIVGSNKPVTVTGYSISGSASANYTFNQPTGLTASITAAPNSIDLAPGTQPVGPYCNGSANTISLTYTTTGTVTAPFVQLSNTSGTFVSGTTNLSSTVTGSGTFTITGTLPAGVTAGTAYRVRIVSSDATPVSSLNNGSNITVDAVPAVAAITGGTAQVCVNANTPAFANTTSGGAWSVTNGTGNATINTTTRIVTGTAAGTVTIVYTVTNGSCTNTATANLTINPLPAPPTGASPQTFCIYPTAPRVSNLSASGVNILWYNNASGGSSIATTTTLVSGNIYYASQTDVNGCTASSRLPVTVSITTTPAPTATSPQTACGGTIADLTATGSNIQWYSVLSGGTPLATSSALINTTYYASQTVGGCESGSRVAVVVHAATPAQPVTITQPATTPCQGTTANNYSIGTVSYATSYTWSVSGTGWLVSAGGSTTSATITAGTGSNTVSVTANNGCGSSSPKNTGTINPPTVVTLGTVNGSDLVCSGNSETYSVSTVAGVTSYNWTIPADWTIVSGGGTNSIVVTPGLASGDVSVSASNTCGTGPTSILSVTDGGSVGTPVGTAASAIGTGSFTANWNTVSGATSYYLDVFTGNVEDFTDGNFTANPVWSGNTSNFSLQTATSLPGGLATTDGSYLGSNASTQYSILTTPSTEVSQWSFSLGSPTYDPSSTNHFGVILMSSAAVSGDIDAANFNGYYLKIGVNSSPDPIELWRSTGATKTKVNDFPFSPDFTSVALENGLNIRVTRSTAGIFELFYSTGFTYPADPTISAGTLTDNNYTTSSYFGIYGRFTNASTSRRVYIDNIQLGAVTYVAGYNNFSTTSTSATISGLNPGTVYNYVVRASNGNCSSGNGNIITATTGTCIPVHSITSFAPITGPVGTLVAITGTNLTGATAVSFSGVAATSFTVVNATTIIAKLPSNVPLNSTILVTKASCDATSSGTFALLKQSGSCGNMSNLIISEVFDPESGNNHYIELFNGTANSINLSSYRLEVVNLPSNTATSIGLTGTINAGAVLVLYAGSNGGLATAPAQGVGVGFNELDQIRLYQNGSIIDRVVAPNNKGYDFQRLNTVNGPTATYTAAQWTLVDDGTENSSNIGIFLSIPSLTIVTHPADVTGCGSLSLTATSSSAATFAWYFQDGRTGGTWATVTQTNLRNADPINSEILISVTQTPASGTTTSSTITLTGDLAFLQNYQFYARASATCIQYTNAAQYSYTTMPVYRTITSAVNANWEDPAQWEMANSVSGPWTPACQYPIAKNSSEVLIQNATSVILNRDIALNKLTISNTGNTGTLSIGANALLTMYNSQSGADLIVNGVLEDNGTSSGGNGLDLLTGAATWNLGASATIIKTNGGSSDYRDAYETGIANIPATANWIYRRVASNISFASSTATTPMYYPNLTLEKETSGLYTSPALNSGNINLSYFTLLGANNPVIIKGDFSIGGNGAGTIRFKSINNFTPVLVEGSLIIKSGNTLENYNTDGTNTYYGDGFEVKGSITNNGTLTTQYNSNYASSGKLILSGSSPQTVSGSGTFNLYDFTVENSPGGSVELMSDIMVPNVCSLRNGVITTHASPGGLLTLGTATNAVAGNPGTSAYINGPMAKQFAINASAEFEYPIGKSTASPVYKPNGVKPETIAGGTTTFTSEYFAGSHPLNALMGGMVLGVSSKEWWDIKKSGGNASNTARVKLYYLNPGDNNWNFYNTSGSPAYSTANVPCATCNVAVVHRDASSSTWNFTSTSGMFSSSAPVEYRFYANEGAIYSAPTSNYSPFTLAYSYNVILALPVKLISFTGKLVVSDGKLDWKIADAKDLSYFDLESSTDGSHFSKLATVQSNGGKGYNYTDPTLAPGNHYYRLLVVDKDGKKYYSQVVLLTVGTVKTYLVGVSPTVVQSQVRPVIFSANQQKATAVITDITGRKLAEITTGLMAGTNQWSIPTTMLPRGTYQLTIFTTDGLRETRRFIKE